MPIVDARGFNLMPDVGAQLGRGLSLLGQSQQLQAQGQQLQAGQQKLETQQQIQQLTGRALQGDDAALRELTALSPQQGAQIRQIQRSDFDAQSEIDKLEDISSANLAVKLRNAPTREAQMQIVNDEVERNARAGRDFVIAPRLKGLLESQDPAALEEFNQLTDMIVNTGQQLGLLKGAAGISPEILKETRGEVRKQLSNVSKETDVIKTNYSKLKNLSGQIRKGNRPAVAQALVALVKIGDPGSIVSRQEAIGALNQQDPIAAIAALFQGKGVSDDVTNSIITKLDPTDPTNVNVDDLLSTAQSLVAASVPNIQNRFASAEEQAASTLTQQGIRSLFTERLRKDVQGLSDLLPGEKAAPELQKMTLEELQAEAARLRGQ